MTLPGFDEHEREAFMAKQHAQQPLAHPSHIPHRTESHFPDNCLVQGLPFYPGMLFPECQPDNLSAYTAPHAVLYPTANHLPTSPWVQSRNTIPSAPWSSPYLQHNQHMQLGSVYAYTDMDQNQVVDMANCDAILPHNQQHAYQRSDSSGPQYEALAPFWSSAGQLQPGLDSAPAQSCKQMQAQSNPASAACDRQCMQQGTSAGATASCTQSSTVLSSTASLAAPTQSMSANLQSSSASPERLCSAAVQATPRLDCAELHTDLGLAHAQVRLKIPNVKVLNKSFRLPIMFCCLLLYRVACFKRLHCRQER